MQRKETQIRMGRTKQRAEKIEQSAISIIQPDELESVASPLRKDFELNQQLIAATMVDLLEASEGKKIPTNGEIAKKCGLSEETVFRHSKNYKFDPIDHPLRVLTPLVVYNIFKLSKTSERAGRTWLHYMEGYSEKVDLSIRTQAPPVDLSHLSFDELMQLKHGHPPPKPE